MTGVQTCALPICEESGGGTFWLPLSVNVRRDSKRAEEMAKGEVKTLQTADWSDGTATRDILHFLSCGALIRPLSSQRAVAFSIVFLS